MCRGSIIAAGAVVISDGIVGGIPAKIISQKFTDAENTLHESILYNQQ